MTAHEQADQMSRYRFFFRASWTFLIAAVLLGSGGVLLIKDPPMNIGTKLIIIALIFLALAGVTAIHADNAKPKSDAGYNNPY